MRKPRSPLIALLTATIWCAGCASAGYDADTNLCPQLKAYTKEFSMELADEIAALPKDAKLVSVVADYMVLRAQVRVCASPM